MSPQYCPPSAGLQEILWQAGPPTHTFLLPHTQSPLAPAVEQSVPQSTARPQPSPTIPQYWPPAAGLQEIAGQSFGPLHKPSWQVHPALAHVVPQSTFPPHLSPSTPQYWSLFAVKQARGVHTSGPPLHMPSVPQAQPGLLQVFPHDTSPPHPSPMLPQYWSPVEVMQVWRGQSIPPLHRRLSHTQPALGQIVLQARVPPHPSPIAPQ
jgi:hypothetical protein